MFAFDKPVTRKQLIEITGMSEASFYRRLKELPTRPLHSHDYSPQEAIDLLHDLGFKLEGEVLDRAYKVTRQKKPADRD